MTTTLDHYSVRVWETKKAYDAWADSQDYFFCDEEGAERFCSTLRKEKVLGGAYAYELSSFNESDCPTTEPFSFWNRKEGFSQ